MGSWTSDATLLDLMRDFVVATNRIRYAQAHPGQDNVAADADLAVLRRNQTAAAAAYEQALVERGWQVPGRRFSPARAEAVSL